MSDSTLQILDAGATGASSSQGGSDEPIALLPEKAGRYLLRELLGKGCMGEVWRAEDPQIGRAVAVKILHVPEGLDGRDRVEWEARFLREARAAGSLSHPGIVAIHDVGKAEDGRSFIVMELVEGKSLDEIARDGPRPLPNVVLGWGVQIAEALDVAHRRGIVHRDIKPANILIDGEGHARIADFGIARLTESDLTREGAFVGSPAYSAPEQIRGLSVDGRADLFSLGATLYALLTGTRPFQGKDLTSAAFAVCYTDPSPPSLLVPGLPTTIDKLLLKSLAKDPGRRHQSGRELAAEIRAFLRAPTAPPSATAVFPSPACFGSPRWIAAVAAALWQRGAGARAGLVAAAIVVGSGAALGTFALVNAARRPALLVRAEPSRASFEEGGTAESVPAEVGTARGGSPLPESSDSAISYRGAAPPDRSAPTSRSAPSARRTAGLPAERSSASPPGGRSASAPPRSAGARPAPAAPAPRPSSITLPTRPSPPAAARAPAPVERQALAAPSSSPQQAEAQPPPPTSLQASAVVTVRIVHNLEEGELSIWSDDRLLLNEPLRAAEMNVELLGSDLFSYRKERAEWLLQIPPGRRSLKVRVESGRTGLSLVKELTQVVSAAGRYAFEIRVRSFPRPHLAVDLKAL